MTTSETQWEWKDITTYTKHDVERIPRSWVIKIIDLRIVVTRHIDHAPDEWFLICDPFVSRTEVGKGSADHAKATALAHVEGILRRRVAILEKLRVNK